MSLTRDFKETVRARIERDPAFRKMPLKEGVECLLAGEVETGKSILRDYVNATVGFQQLAGLTNKSSKSLMRMLGPHGNPQAVFHCVACGHADHADLNVARNIRRWGMALLHGEGHSVQPTPATRERDRALMAQAVQSTI